MAEALASTGTDDAAITAGGDGAASHPSPTQSDAAGKPGNTAPPGNLHREAFDRLVKGEEPKAVNRAVFAEKKAPEAPQRQGQQQQAPTEDPNRASNPNGAPEPEKPATTGLAAKFGFPEGTSDKDVQVLKRAKMDADTWAAIPPSNRVKILTNLRATQVAADRVITQQRKGGQGQARTQAPPETQTNPDDEDDVTLGGGEQSDELHEPTEEQPLAQPAAARAGKGGRGTAATAAAAEPTAEQVAEFIDPEDLETLKLLGGDDLAQTYTRGIGRVVSHMNSANAELQQKNSQLLGAVEFLLNDHVEGQFNRGLDALEQVSGLENIRDPERKEEREALKKKADLLHRAAGDPSGYTYQEAMQDAAASLFKTNITQTAQASLLKGRTDSLRGTPDSGPGRRAEPRTLTPQERSRAIFAELQRGTPPEQAGKVVDGR